MKIRELIIKMIEKRIEEEPKNCCKSALRILARQLEKERINETTKK